jgi:hypothetical protein
MAEENGKPQNEVEDAASSSEVEFEPMLKVVEREVRATGPTTCGSRRLRASGNRF